MTEARANEIYNLAKGVKTAMGDGVPFDTFMTDEEKKVVYDKWLNLPGASCWNDAFFSFMSKDALPPYMRRRFSIPQEKWEEV